MQITPKTRVCRTVFADYWQCAARSPVVVLLKLLIVVLGVVLMRVSLWSERQRCCPLLTVAVVTICG